jgi:hypothetical protein
MSNSYRIRTQVGIDKSIKVHLTQDFEFLEILSIKILESDIYTRQCSDYGVVIGRISINNGFGVPNCKVSIFVPLSSVDANNPIISDLYPYSSVSDLNDVGYRYNLLPYVKSYSNHTPTGSFFDKEDVLLNQSYIEVFDKYYRYTAVTNESGDFMIFGVPLGTQTIHVDVDLSDIGEFSLSPQDLIRLGLATEAQVSGTRFKSSSNLNELPQIISINRIITVEPLWGQPDICNIGINRIDFDLSAEANVVIQPTAIFMGSMFSDVDNLALKSNCKPKFKQGELCSLAAGPGEILVLRQTIDNDAQGRPILEVYELEQNGQVIDDNGTWLLDIPMNLDYVTTNEFGERVTSNDPKVGIPTKGKYRFKVKWNQSPELDDNVRRAYFLVPNVREYGWNVSNIVDPLINPTNLTNQTLAKKSYAFSLDWNDYADPQTAINCEDTFYQFSYNKVYTVSQLIDQYRGGTLANRILSIKNILDDTCESTNNKFPTNDTIMRFDFIYLLYYVFSSVFRPVLIALVFVIHYLYFLFNAIRYFLIPALITFCGVQIYFALAGSSLGLVALTFTVIGYSLLAIGLGALLIYLLQFRLKGIDIPLLLYDLCEFCKCGDAQDINDEDAIADASQGLSSPPIPIPPTNVSGVQIVDLGATFFYGSLIDQNTDYINFNTLSQGYVIKYPPIDPVCYSRVPRYIVSSYTPPTAIDCTGNDDEPKNSVYLTMSLTLAERINLFNAKAKYFGYPSNSTSASPTNPGGGVNRIKVKLAPDLNIDPNKVHYDNVICMLLTPESLSSLSTGTILSFINPSNSKDKNFNQAALNTYGTNSITGETIQLPITNNTTQITVNYTNPQNPSSTLSTIYQIPIPNSADTNYHKFPSDIEYFQVITAMTVSQFESNQRVFAFNDITYTRHNLWERYINNNMAYTVLYKGKKRFQQSTINLKPIKGIENYENQVLVFLVRGVDPYTTRVMTRYGLGRLFGHKDEDAVQITGMTKLNIPVQGNFKNIKHDGITTSTATDSSYSGMKLYYDSYYYKPSFDQYSSFTSNNHTYYSSLRSTGVILNSQCNNNTICSGNLFGSSQSGAYVISQNHFTFEFRNGRFNSASTPPCTRVALPNLQDSSIYTKGYFVNEIVEGTSLMSTSIKNDLPRLRQDRLDGGIIIIGDADKDWTKPNNILQTSQYYAPKYSSATTLNHVLGTSERQIVMRSDRLPTSDRLQDNCGNSYSLQQNQNLGIYIIPDEGAVPIQEITSFTEVSGDTFPPNFTAELLRTTNSCKDSRNLGCYKFIPNPPIPGNPSATTPGGGRYELLSPEECSTERRKLFFDKGCYKLVTRIIKSIPTDIILINEWLSRTNITFAACRNVFSHLFTHNWVNGTLYAFAFKNNKTFDINGRPIPQYCRSTIYFDEDTNNFYYRSSPYRDTISGSGFVGREAPISPINNNLLFPTTIMDLGPRTDYLQELTFSNDFDGYVLKNMKTTSYQDVSELLNLLIITRLVNTSYRDNIFITNDGGSIFNYFTRKPLTSLQQRRAIDGDYAQMISINSELGVVPFEAENYPSISGFTLPQYPIDPVYFNSGSIKDVIFGIFYSSDTQVRDYISPKRTIINNNVLANDSCAFNYFGCYSQEVPFYQWEINPNSTQSNPDRSIFGSQKNDWNTNPISGAFFFSKRYQDLDRANSTSRYFRTNTSIFVGDKKGYIYSIDTRQQPPNPFYTNPSLNPLATSWDRNNDNSVTVGAPFYFYFGLKKGASAFDRFVKKWIRTETI